MKIAPFGTLSDILDHHPDAIFYVSTATCPPCKRLRPVIDANSYPFAFVDMSVYEPYSNARTIPVLRELQNVTKLRMSVPRILIFESGEYKDTKGGTKEIVDYLTSRFAEAGQEFNTKV